MRQKLYALLVGLCAATLVIAGCKSTGDYHRQADDVAYKIIKNKQEQALGHTEAFTIKTPAQKLWRKIIETQNLPYAAPASLGVAALKPLDHWPDDNLLEVGKAPATKQDKDNQSKEKSNDAAPIVLSLHQALEVAAHNSHEYQAQKEKVYESALALDLEKDNFRTIFSGALGASVQGNPAGGRNAASTLHGSISGNFTQQFKNGITVTGALVQDFIKMLTGGHVSVSGLSGDSSVTIPLLRGAGDWVVAEPLTQAQRDTIYAIRSFERYKKTFAVQIFSEYLSVLQNHNTIVNDENNYRNATIAARRARVQANAGRLQAIQVGQAVQNQLKARASWISAKQRYAGALDDFKDTLGLPVDANIQLNKNELEHLSKKLKKEIPASKEVDQVNADNVPPANEPVHLKPLDTTHGGPLEIGYPRAIRLAFAYRLDLRNSEGAVYDAERQIPIAANGFLPGAQIVLSGSASRPNMFKAENWDYNAMLNIDLPFDHTSERNKYRESIIKLHSAVRDFQDKANQIKLSIRDELRTLLQSREGLHIQTKAVKLAEERVESTQMFFDAGRAEIRDVLEAQNSLNSAQNSLTSAMVKYREAELELQRDMGVLKVNADGLITEYVPSKSVSNNKDERSGEVKKRKQIAELN